MLRGQVSRSHVPGLDSYPNSPRLGSILNLIPCHELARDPRGCTNFLSIRIRSDAAGAAVVTPTGSRSHSRVWLGMDASGRPAPAQDPASRFRRSRPSFRLGDSSVLTPSLHQPPRLRGASPLPPVGPESASPYQPTSPS